MEDEWGGMLIGVFGEGIEGGEGMSCEGEGRKVVIEGWEVGEG